MQAGKRPKFGRLEKREAVDCCVPAAFPQVSADEGASPPSSARLANLALTTSWQNSMENP